MLLKRLELEVLFFVFFVPEVNKHAQAVGNAEARQARLRHLPQRDHLPAANVYQLLVYAALNYWCMRP
jgi:hypothetical protein